MDSDTLPWETDDIMGRANTDLFGNYTVQGCADDFGAWNDPDPYILITHRCPEFGHDISVVKRRHRYGWEGKTLLLILLLIAKKSKIKKEEYFLFFLSLFLPVFTSPKFFLPIALTQIRFFFLQVFRQSTQQTNFFTSRNFQNSNCT